MTDCLSRTEFRIPTPPPTPIPLSLYTSLSRPPHPLRSIRNLMVSLANDFLLTVTPVCVRVCVCVPVCLSRGWQYHLSGCCSPCPCPAGGHWVMGEDFLILPPWDTHTHTLVCNTYCRSELENKRQRQRESFFFLFGLRILSDSGCQVRTQSTTSPKKPPQNCQI